MSPDHKNSPSNGRSNEFSLGTAPLDARPPMLGRRARRLFLPLSALAVVILIILLGSSLIVGTRFTQSLHFENRELTFFEGVRIIGDSLLGTGQTLEGERVGRINVLLLGRAGEKYPGRNLTDTVMLLSIDMERKRIGLLSLPRDLFVPIPDSGLSSKLNSLYQIGLNAGVGTEIVSESVALITGQPIHYTAMIDFDGFERMIDALGGIHVEVLRNIYDERYPGKNYSYETFSLTKGWQKLDGKTALKYARERHDDPEGDFGRAKRQQQILQAIRDKIWTAPTLLNPFVLSNFLESLGESVTTDIAPEEIGRFVELARELDTKNVSTIVVDAWRKESLLRVSHIESGGIRAFILVPRSGTWEEIQTVAAQIFDERVREQQAAAIKQETAHILILTKPEHRADAMTLADDIRDTYPIGSVRVETNRSLDGKTETAIIQDKGNLRTPFTLDGLIARYGLSLGSIPGLAETRPIDPTPDLVILFQQDVLLSLPTLDRTENAPLNTDFQEPLAPLANPFAR